MSHAERGIFMERSAVLKAFVPVLTGFMLVLTGFMLVLTACSKAQPLSTEDVAAAYSGDFACSAVITTAEDEFAVDIEKRGGSIAFTVTAPASMAGLSVVLDGDCAAFDYCGISAAFAANDLPAAAPAMLFRKAAQALSLPDGIFLSVEQTRIAARFDCFSAELNPADFALVRLTFPEQDTVFTIENFRFLEKK